MRRLYHVTGPQFLALALALVAIVACLAPASLAFAAPGDAGIDASTRRVTADAAAPAAAEAPPAEPVAPSPPPAPAPPPASAPPPLPVVADTTPAPSGAASAAPTTSPSAAPSAPAAPRGATEVRMRERVVFSFRAGRAGRTPEERARAANAAIESLLAHPDELGDARWEEAQGNAVVYLGKTPVATLGPEDVAVTGDPSVSVLAAQVTARLSDAASSERKRSAIATTVFNFSILIFSALIAFLILGRVGELVSRFRATIVDDPERLHAVRLGKIEFVSAGAARGVTSIAVTLGHRLIQFAIAYGWLIFGLSLFEATRGYTQRLTGLVVAPLSGLATRIGSALPLVIVAAIAVLAVTILVRFVGLFFDSVSRGDTRVGWLPRDLARPTSILVRVGIVVVTLVVASPLITGSDDGSLSRTGIVAVLALGLATTPLLASVAVGVSVVFSRRLRKGEHVEVGGRSGRLVDATLLDFRLEDSSGCEVRVPHLLALVHPMRVQGHAPLVSVEVVTTSGSDTAKAEAALLSAARELSARGRVELLSLDAEGAHWRVTSASRGPTDKTLGRAVADALATAGIELGRRRAREVP